MPAQILCTLGPASMNDRVVARLEELGVSLFRLNLSHIRAEDLPEMIEFLQKRTSVPICLDTEGAQIRTGYFVEDHVVLRENSAVRVPRSPVPGDSRCFNLYPTGVIDRFEVGDYMTIDTTVLVQVVDTDADGLVMRVLTGGPVGRNKATTLERDIPLDPLTEKDVRALAIGRDMGIRHVALSFANRASDVAEIRRLSAPGAFVISKIECLGGLAHLEAIAAASDALLIDRGDLSRQVPHERLPLVQKRIIALGKAKGFPVYVATNLMESMRTEPVPTHAEVSDVFNTLADGAGGLVLAAETAVGKFPIGCASMLRKLIQSFEEAQRGDPLAAQSTPVSLLVEPHARALVQGNRLPLDASELAALPSLDVTVQDLRDCEQIAAGTYSPLDGFLGSEALEHVLSECRLPDGVVWPMPIVLPVPAERARQLGVGDRVRLRSNEGSGGALLEVSEIFSFAFGPYRERLGRDASVDPRIRRLIEWNGAFVAGRVDLIERPESPARPRPITPLESRYVLNKKGWSRTIAFHTHSLPHLAHEAILKRALADTHADGIFVSIETGALAPGDLPPQLMMRCYETLLDFGLFPRRNLLLGSAATYGRGQGVREALFLAICRKNMGFSHLLLGDSDTDRGREVRRLLDSVGDLGIEPIFFETLGYDPTQRSLAPASAGGVLAVNGEVVREALRNRERLPAWLMHPVLQDFVLAEVARAARGAASA